MLPLTAFSVKVRGTEYHEATDPETEIWRVCQRPGTAGEWVDASCCSVTQVAARVYLIQRRQAFPLVLRTPYAFFGNVALDQEMDGIQALNISYVGTSGR
jgi:hypothetical protein